jgi:hypothetical protein
MKTLETQSPYVIGAKNVRKELKTAFPQTTFKVSSKGYNGGDQINIKWVDGPTTDKVEKISNKYKDLETAEPNPNGSAKYVFTDRTLSDRSLNITSRKLQEKWDWLSEEHGFEFPSWSNGKCETNQSLHGISCAPHTSMELWVEQEAKKADWNIPENAGQSMPLPDSVIEEKDDEPTQQAEMFDLEVDKNTQQEQDLELNESLLFKDENKEELQLSSDELFYIESKPWISKFQIEFTIVEDALTNAKSLLGDLFNNQIETGYEDTKTDILDSITEKFKTRAKVEYPDLSVVIPVYESNTDPQNYYKALNKSWNTCILKAQQLKARIEKETHLAQIQHNVTQIKNLFGNDPSIKHTKKGTVLSVYLRGEVFCNGNIYADLSHKNRVIEGLENIQLWLQNTGVTTEQPYQIDIPSLNGKHYSNYIRSREKYDIGNGIIITTFLESISICLPKTMFRELQLYISRNDTKNQ